MKKAIAACMIVLAAGYLCPFRAAAQDGATSQSYGGKVYVFGGAYDVLGQPVPSNDLSVFDPETGTRDYLQSYDPWPEARMGHSCTAIGDKMYIFGGRNAAGVPMNDLWEFDMKNRTWRKLDPGSKPMPRSETTLGALNGILYVAGGRFYDGTSQYYVHSINPLSSAAWTVMPPMPEPLQSAGCFVYNNTLNIIGGYWHDWDNQTAGNQPSYSANVWSFRQQPAGWTQKETTGTPREVADFGIAQDDKGTVYVTGGKSFDYQNNHDYLSKGCMVYDPQTGYESWTPFTHPTLCVSGQTDVWVKKNGMKSTSKGFLYQIGGVLENGRITDRIMEINLDTWEAVEVWHSTGMDERPGSGVSLIVFPNPASDQLTLSISPGRTLRLTTILYDMQGREVLAGPQSRLYHPGNHILTLDISSLPTGIYTLRMSGGDYTEVRRVVVE